jgi:L-fuconolactonase
MQRIDSHQHFWRYDAAEYPWIASHMQVLARDWLPEDLRPLMQARGIERCVAVQARSSEAETDFLLALAAQHPWIAGVVGWVELREGDVAPRLARWDGQAVLKGMRHVLQVEADVRAVLASPVFRRNVAVLQARGLVYDLLVQAHQFEGLAGFCAALDGHTLVLDHLGKPAVRERGDAAFEAWRQALRPVAALPHVMCKLSGLVTEARWREGQLDGHTPADFHRYLDTALELFGPQRLMFGSDWPVCQLAQAHAEVVALIEDWAQRLSPDERAALWGGNAQRCYGID